MKILIVSDTHRRDGNLLEVIEKTAPFDMMIHLGDTEGSEAYFNSDWIKTIFAWFMWYGEIMISSPIRRRRRRFPLEKYRAFLCHGHMYGVSLGTENIKEEARSRKVNIVMFGHTHKPYLEYCSDGLVVLNPGSLSYPRQDGRHPSFMIMEIDRFGEAHYTTNFL